MKVLEVSAEAEGDEKVQTASSRGPQLAAVGVIPQFPEREQRKKQGRSRNQNLMSGKKRHSLSVNHSLRIRCKHRLFALRPVVSWYRFASKEQDNMNKQVISTANAPKAIGPYEQAVKIGGWVYVSGQIPLNPDTGALVEGDIAVQTRRVLENLRAVVEAAGSSFERTVKTTVFLKNISDFSAMNEVYAEYFGAAKPARSTVAVADLPRGALVEIDLIAVT